MSRHDDDGDDKDPGRPMDPSDEAPPREPSPTQMFEVYEARLQHLATKLHGLHTLLAHMQKAPKAFDREDVEHVQAYIQQYEEEQDKLRDEWRRRESVYHTTFKSMAEALRVRTQILEHVDEATGVLEHNPELMDLLVKKQSKLTAMVQTMRDKLMAAEPTA